MIRELKRDEYELAKQLIMDTYNKTEAINDTLKGRARFYDEFVDGKDLNEMLDKDELHVFGYFNDNLMGVISIMDDGYIMHLFVGIDYMNRGIASSLLNYLFIEAKKRGIGEIKLDSSVYALDFYLKHGFSKTDDLIKEDGMSYIPLHKYI